MEGLFSFFYKGIILLNETQELMFYTHDGSELDTL